MSTSPTLNQIIQAWPHYTTQYRPDALLVSAAVDLLGHIAQHCVIPLEKMQQIPLRQGLGRVLAQDLVATRDIPPHDNAAMDGYALHSRELQTVTGDSLLSLQVVATVLAGQVWSGSLRSGQCLKIMTGAALPAAVDTVVPHELVQITDSPVATIQFKPQQVRAGDHCRRRGEDLTVGSVALQRGCILTPAALGLAASLGVAELPVLPRLRVAYFSTGNEILAPSDVWREGAIYDSNRSSLQGLLTQLGCEVIDLGAVPDDPSLLQNAFADAAAQADVVITSGGVSTGDADLTHSFLGGTGEVLYWKLAMRPGRPLAVGRHGQALLLGLPGNPVAAMVSFYVLLRPTLLRMMGAHELPVYKLHARSLQAIAKKPGRTEFLRGVLSNATDGSLQVQSTGQQGSGILSSMVQANCLMVLPHQLGSIAVGDRLEVWLLHNQLGL